MSLIDSLNPAVAGLKVQQRKVEVVGDNIANVDTPSFKTARVEFSTIFSQVLSFGAAPDGAFGGVNPIQVGKGTKLAAVSRDFTQGAVSVTGVASDLAIEGDGFFVVKTGTGELRYTRDGSFSLSATNLLHDAATGAVAQGWLADEDFQIAPGGPLEDITIPVGSLSIARETSEVSMQGILNSAGDVASSGTWIFSRALFDRNTTNSDLISSVNPLGLEPATSSTRLEDLVVSLGDYTSYTSSSAGSPATSSFLFPDLQSVPTGLEIDFTVSKGDRRIDAPAFTVGASGPNGGETLGDLVTFLGNAFGVTDGTIDGAEAAEHAFSHQRESTVTGRPIGGTLTSADTFTLNTLGVAGGDFRGVQVGDFVRFTSGGSNGQVAEILNVRDVDADGVVDTVDLRADGFNSLTKVPEQGDTYVIQARAGVNLAEEQQIHQIDGSTVAVAGPTINGDVTSFSITDPSVSDFINEHGIRVNQTVSYNSSSGAVEGVVLAVSGNTITFGNRTPVSGSLTPTASTTFTFSEAPAGSVEIAGNVGEANGLSDFEVMAGGDLISFFQASPLAEAAGEGVNTTFTVYDSLGTPHEIELTFVYESAAANGPNILRYFAEAQDDADPGRVVGNGIVQFDSQGQFLGTGNLRETIRLDLRPAVDLTNGSQTPLTFEIDFSRISLLASASSSVQLLEQDGFRAGTLREYSVSSNGVINGVFDNGLTRDIGQVALARFQNNNGLVSAGNNYFKPSSNSGDPLVGEAGTLSRGTIRGGALEESNVDLAEQFTQLITGQRAFQANARTISASDQMLQELVNLI